MPQENTVPIPEGATIGTSTAVVPPVGKDSFISETGKQLKATGKGILNLVTGDPLPVQQALPHMLGEMIKAPLRELGGNPQPGKSVLTAPTNIPERLEGAFSAALGGDPAAARDQFQRGNTGAGLADLYAIPAITAGTGGLLKRVLPGILPSVEEGSNMLTKAAGATEGKAIDFPKEFANAIPELDKTPPKVPFNKMTVADLNGHVQDTFNRLEGDFNSRFAPIARQQVLPQSVADEIRHYKIPNPVTPEDMEWNNKLESRAVLFERPHSFESLNTQRMRARDRIGDFYKQFPSTQGSKMGSNVGIVLDTAINDATRNLIYDTLDRTYAGQVPTDYFRNLKRTEASLYNIKDQLGSRAKQLSNQSAKDFLDRARVHSYVSSGGHMGAAVGGLAEAIFPETKSAQKNARNAFLPKRDFKPALGGALPPLLRRGEPSLAPDEDDTQ